MHRTLSGQAIDAFELERRDDEIASQIRLLVRSYIETWGLPASPYSTADNLLLRTVERHYLEAATELAEVFPPAREDEPEVEGWGVYVLRQESGRAFYVGMTGRYRKRMQRHQREFGHHMAEVDWHPTETRREALDLETRLIAELEPAMNIAKVQS